MKALDQRTVALTRSEQNADELAKALEGLGALVLIVPTIRHVEGGDAAVLERVFREKNSYSHLLFTSPVAVRFFCEASSRQGISAAAWQAVRIAAVGPRTARSLEEAGLPPHLTAEGNGGKALARELLEKELLGPGSRVLLPQSAIARPELREILEAAGVAVDPVVIYDTLPERPEKLEPFFQALDQGQAPDAILFTSPSTLKAFLELSGEKGAAALRHARMHIVSIGPTTSEAIRSERLKVAAEAKSPTVEGLVDAVLRSLSA